MKFGEAVFICKDINSEKYTLEEKINAIDVVMKAPTINSVFKDDLCEVIRFLLSICTQPADQMPTNEDWFVELTTEEKAKALDLLMDGMSNLRFEIEEILNNGDFDMTHEEAVEMWLKQPHKGVAE